MSQRPTNIAVVAVHGVGQHEPGATAKAIGQLLLRTEGQKAESCYAPFHEEALDIPNHLLNRPGSAAAAPKKKRKWRFPNFNERLPGLGRALPPEALADAARTPPDVRLMDALLEAYQHSPAEAVYETTRFNGQRLEDGKPRTNLHIYEMYWADFASIGNRFWSVFGDLYQLVIHLPYLGLQSIDFANEEEEEAPTSWRWWLLRRSYLGALRAFTGLIPTLNLLMLALCLTIVAQGIPAPGLQHLLVAALPAGVVGGAVICGLYRWNGRVARWMPLIIVVLVLGIILGAYLLWQEIDGVQALKRVVTLEAWAVLAVPLHLISRRFEANRPGVYPIAVIGFVVLSLLLSHYALGGPDVLVGLMHTFEWAYIALFVSWFVFATCASVVMAVGWLPGLKATLRRVAYTTRLTIALPLIVFTLATLLTWGAIYHGAAQQLLPKTAMYHARFCYPALEIYPPADAASLGVDVKESRCAFEVAPAWFSQAFEGPSSSRLAWYSLIAVGVSLLLVLSVIAPSVWAELFPPRDGSGSSKRSSRLGGWLTSGLGVGRLAGELCAAAVVLTWLASALVIPRWHTWQDYTLLAAVRGWIGASQFASLYYGGLLVSGSALGIIALSKRFATLGLGLKPALAAAIDVDVYLRELPHARTPRARMIERYVSLLRYVSRWQDPLDRPHGYDAIIIVAHSQGTVITADLLRYLQHRPSLAFRDIPVLFLSLGCPLHQLYARRFPHLYKWVAEDELSKPSKTPTISDLRGVKRWVNLYRSGDYVGRALWRGEQATAYDTDKPWNDQKGRLEFCLGSGAHTHYWDATAADVGAELDKLIAEIEPSEP